MVLRVSGWLFLLQQVFGSWMLLTALCRWLRVKVKPFRTMAASALIGLAVTAAGSSPIVGAAAALLIAAAPRAVGVRLPLLMLRRVVLLTMLLTFFCVGVMHVLDASPLPRLLLPASAVLALLLPTLDSRAPSPGCSSVTIAVGAKTIRLTALIDSGNLLRDHLTGLPVIVCSRRAAEALAKGARSIRLISVRTAAGSGLMPVFRADRIRLFTQGKWHEADALVGLASSGYDGFQALVPQTLTETPAVTAVTAPSMQGGSP